MDAGRSCWRERELLFLIALVGCTHFARLETLTLRGEETRRAQVAAEILASGDWVVPRQQGNIYLSRPPLGNWLIAISASVRGELDTLAVRLPTVLAILATTLLIYVYMRDFVSRTSALLAAAAYPTMGQVLQIGRLAETEGVFTLLVSSSLLVWHRGLVRGWPVWLTWSAGYTLAALAGLAKGPQGPLYFVASTWLFLLLARDWRRLWGRGHLVGMLAFMACLGSWQIPYYLRTNLASVYGIWTGNALARYQDHQALKFVQHLLTYPFEILICTLPWSLVLRQYFRRSFYSGVAGARPSLTFVTVCLLATFPTVWFAAGAKGRYFMPLYPLLAVLVGVGVEHCLRARPGTAPRREWNQLMGGGAALGALAAVGMLIVPHIEQEWAARVTLPWGIAVCLLVLALLVGVVSWLAAQRNSVAWSQLSVLAFAGLIGWAYVGPIVTAQSRIMNDVDSAVQQVWSKLPPDVRLTSLGVVSHRFRHYSPKPIEHLAWPPPADEPLPEFEYFCFGEQPLEVPIDFAWELVAEISIDRNKHPEPKNRVVVGRRLSAPTLATHRKKSHLD